MAGQDAGVREGSTFLFPPPRNLANKGNQPGARAKGQPFYNPGMALNRDLSVLLVEAEARRRGRELDVADALCGTGARALRLAHEVKGPVVVHANDAQPQAIAALRAGIPPNGIMADRLTVHEGDAHVFLASGRFDIVDLDPCGSPMPFADAAIRATRHGGLLCATATDTGALCGTFPRACRRRYDAHHGLHAAHWRAEVGLRILGGALLRAAARSDRVATPVLSIAHGHWMRVVARVQDGKRDADEALKRLAYAVPDPRGGGRLVPLTEVRPREPDSADAPPNYAGPLWSGPLHEAALVDALRAALAGRESGQLARHAEVASLLDLLRQEAEAPAFWVVSHDLEARLGAPPRRDVLMERLRAAGFHAARTHMDPQGVRTDAPAQALAAAWSAQP